LESAGYLSNPLKGQLENECSDWFVGLTMTHPAEGDTLLTG
jgi:hypothetical protein